jgi:hypothetical protein
VQGESIRPLALAKRSFALGGATQDNGSLCPALVRVELDIINAKPVAACDHARSALEAGEKVGTPTARMNGLWALGIAHRLDEQWDEAVPVLQEAVSYAVSGVMRSNEGEIRAALAEALLGRRDLGRAEYEAQAAVKAAHAHHSKCDEIRANLCLAHTHELQCAQCSASTNPTSSIAVKG